MTESQEDVRDALRRMYGLSLTYLESERIEIIPPTLVHIFAIHGHHSALKVYGWSYERASETVYFGALHLNEINCPTAAVLKIGTNPLIP